METPKLITANVYRHPQTAVSLVSQCHFGLYVGGLEYMRLWLPDGRLLSGRSSGNGPGLYLRLPGMKADFSFNEKRENWVIQMEMAALDYDPESGLAVWSCNGCRFPLPFALDVQSDEIPALRHQFAQIRLLLNSNLPRNIATAEIRTLGILSRFLAHARQPDRGDAVERFKQSIDEDTHFEYSLGELAGRMGLSQAHLRRQFRKRYQLDPAEYRAGRRLNRIMELIAHTDLPLKEIAGMAGMKNITHLYLLIKKHYRTTPGSLIRQCRGAEVLKG